MASRSGRLAFTNPIDRKKSGSPNAKAIGKKEDASSLRTPVSRAVSIRNRIAANNRWITELPTCGPMPKCESNSPGGPFEMVASADNVGRSDTNTGRARAGCPVETHLGTPLGSSMPQPQHCRKYCVLVTPITYHPGDSPLHWIGRRESQPRSFCAPSRRHYELRAREKVMDCRFPIREFKLSSSIVAISHEDHWFPNDPGYGLLVFRRKVVQESRR